MSSTRQDSYAPFCTAEHLLTSGTSLEARMLRALEGPATEHEGAVAELATEFPDHSATLWRWLAEVRRESTTRSSLALPILAPRTPEHCGPYVIAERLGQGGMGTVYSAQHAETGASVALKVIRADLVDQAEARERFRRELDALRRIEHPALCPVLDVGDADGVPFFAMPRLAGEDLARKIARTRAAGGRGPVVIGEGLDPLHALLRFFEQAAGGLHAAHQAGFIHRDVKPGNLFCTEAGAPVVLDFGLARDVNSARTTLAGSRELLGTIEYMSPEQVRGSRALDASADVYALAASLFEALTLELPVRGRSRSETLDRILRVDALSLAKLRPELPRELSLLLERSLDKDPRRRPRDAASFATELERVRHGERVSLRADSPLRRLQRWSLRNPVAAIALAATTLFSVTATLLITARDEALDREQHAHRQAAEALAKFRLTEHATRLAEARIASRALPPLTASHATRAYEAWMAKYADPLRAAEGELRAQRDLLKRASDGPAENQAQDLEITTLRVALQDFESRCATLRPEEEEVDKFWFELAELQRGAMQARLSELEATRQDAHVRFANDGAQQFLYNELGRLLADLAQFADDRRDGIAGIEHRLALAQVVHAPLDAAAREAWAAVNRELSTDPRFPQFELTPEPDLLPLGRDPRSGLQEFACLASGTPPQRRAGELVIGPSSAIVFVLLPGGTTRIGSQRRDAHASRYDAYSPSDMGPHEVQLEAFFIAKHELSQGQWKRLSGGANPSYVRPGNVPGDQLTGDEYPVENLSWHSAREVLRIYGMDLPSEAQWEFGARAGSDAVFPWGSTPQALEGYANLFGHEMLGLPANLPGGPAPFDDGAKLPLRIDALEANAFGLHHVIGNVAEWCRDAFWTWRTTFAARDGVIDFPLARYRCLRGGSYLDGWLNARITSRRKALPDSSQASLGVRPARALSSR